jgi:hypothetical protein
MKRNVEPSNDEILIWGKRFHSKDWRVGLSIFLAIILCALVIIGIRTLPFFLFLISTIAVQHPALYLISVAVLFVFSIIGILRSDKNDNSKLFYGSAFLFCLSILAGILYFILPVIFWLGTKD